MSAVRDESIATSKGPLPLYVGISSDLGVLLARRSNGEEAYVARWRDFEAEWSDRHRDMC